MFYTVYIKRILITGVASILFTLFFLCTSYTLAWMAMLAGGKISKFFWPDTFPVIFFDDITALLGLIAIVGSVLSVAISPIAILFITLKTFWSGITLTAIKACVKIYFTLASIFIFSLFFIELLRISA